MLKKKDRMRSFSVLLKPATIALIKANSRGESPYRWFIEEAIACYMKKNKGLVKEREASPEPEREIKL